MPQVSPETSRSMASPGKSATTSPLTGLSCLTLDVGKNSESGVFGGWLRDTALLQYHMASEVMQAVVVLVTRRSSVSVHACTYSHEVGVPVNEDPPPPPPAQHFVKF